MFHLSTIDGNLTPAWKKTRVETKISSLERRFVSLCNAPDLIFTDKCYDFDWFIVSWFDGWLWDWISFGIERYGTAFVSGLESDWRPFSEAFDYRSDVWSSDWRLRSSGMGSAGIGSDRQFTHWLGAMSVERADGGEWKWAVGWGVSHFHLSARVTSLVFVLETHFIPFRF